MRALGILAAALAIGTSASCSPDTPDCSTDDQCSAEQVCKNRFCTTVTCKTDEDCRRGSVCDESLTCVVGCRVDTDCELGLACTEESSGPNQCEWGCRTDADCSTGSVCLAGVHLHRCTPGCRVAADCPESAFCLTLPGESAGRCAPGCRIDAQCSPDSLCDYGVCYQRCRPSVACENGSACVSLNDMGDFRTDVNGALLGCAIGDRCRCRSTEPAPAPCGGYSQCGVGFTCSTSHECIESCYLDGGCVADAPDARAAARDAGPDSG